MPERSSFHEVPARTVDVAGVAVPTFLYGTAWKEAETTRLTAQALELGFRGVDTANQRKHYVEADVGVAVARAVHGGGLVRSALFLQTKFTYARGQDQRIPYDVRADHRTQVLQSFQSSLEHLGTDYVDSYVLHGPERSDRLTAADHAVWQAMAELATAGRVRLLGVSNVGPTQLAELWRTETVKPAFVQNRCYASTGWDREVREFCRSHSIRYQAFSLLTANPHVLRDARARAIAERIGATPAQLVFRFAFEVGMLALTGTSSPIHARQDLEVYDLVALTAEERTYIERVGGPR
jgi:diketogulonate reductase-like aldo/keto reductase